MASSRVEALTRGGTEGRSGGGEEGQAAGGGASAPRATAEITSYEGDEARCLHRRSRANSELRRSATAVEGDGDGGREGLARGRGARRPADEGGGGGGGGERREGGEEREEGGGRGSASRGSQNIRQALVAFSLAYLEALKLRVFRCPTASAWFGEGRGPLAAPLVLGLPSRLHARVRGPSTSDPPWFFLLLLP